MSVLSALKNAAGAADPSGLHYSTQVADGVYQIRHSIVNSYLLGQAGAASGDWVLVDAGLYMSAGKIRRAAEELYGEGSRPAAIILTHGHFDHVGALKTLLEEWDVPVYAHFLEFPYLDGRSSYPPPDPSVGGGAMAFLSPLYPRGPIDVSSNLVELPDNGDVPGTDEWIWLHTPGHTPGHISLFRESDGMLIAGDAFVTTQQESVVGALLQPREINGPPMYYTTDWEEAWESVVMLSRLRITGAATGHGRAMYGHKLAYGLEQLAEDFWEVAVPNEGRYVDDPAYADEDGVAYIPPRVINNEHVAVAALGVVALGALLLFSRRK